MKNFKLWNTITGWIMFLVAAIVYLMTIEPTVSWWDCGEFISAAYKLEVGHPPGAPLFMLLGRFFTMFTGNPEKVAMMVNAMSALVSALTILFLFWTITHFARKIVASNGFESLGQIIAVIGSGIVGAMAFTFTDSFWFSAVEGEVYATSSLFTAIVFWAILKYEQSKDSQHENRWIILIAYLMGLSIGVHLLNLLAIPALAYVVYFKKSKTASWKGIILVAIISLFILGFIQVGVIKWITGIAAKFELLFVNSFGLPYNSGIIFYSILFIAVITFLIWWTIKHQKRILNTIILAFTVIVIGYSTYGIVVIRSLADPPIDMNNPENVFTLIDFLNREQYGDFPILYGPYYNAPIKESIDDRPIYIRKNGKYEIAIYRQKYKYDSRFETFFPRMYSNQGHHIKGYKSWADIKGEPISVQGPNGEMEIRYKPTFGENLKFFFKYQLGHMYFRYFMWNFVGKQSDTQSYGGVTKGNWISGIKGIDKKLIGPDEKRSPLTRDVPSRNTYYFLPFIIGLLGFTYHIGKHPKDSWVVFMLFLLTGIAIIVYLNQKPMEPRERDYAYVGSFYAFAIWIGLGVLAIYELLSKVMSKTISGVLATVITFLLVPTIMASENWDDHDRSGRYIARDFAHNYLGTCDKNAVLVTNADNDTYPLWYAQEVEAYRTDVKVMCTALLRGDWYIDLMARKSYDADPVPFSMTKDKYEAGKRDIVFVYERFKEPYNLKDVIRFVADDSRASKLDNRGELVDYFPTKTLRIPVDADKVIANGIVPESKREKIVPYLEIQINENYVTKDELMVLDMIANNDWKRPIYFVDITGQAYKGLRKYLQLDGFAYKLVPLLNENNQGNQGRIDTDLLYNNLMNEYSWGRMNEPDVLICEHNNRMIKVIKVRDMFAQLANVLSNQGEKEKAIEVLNRCEEIMPYERFPYDYYAMAYVQAWYNTGDTALANNVATKMFEFADQELDYFTSLSSNQVGSAESDIQMSMFVLQNLSSILQRNNEEALLKKVSDRFMIYYNVLNPQKNMPLQQQPGN